MIRPRQRLHAVSVVDYRGGTACAGTTARRETASTKRSFRSLK